MKTSLVANAFLNMAVEAARNAAEEKKQDFKLELDDDGNLLIPENVTELADFLEKLWDIIFESEKPNKNHIEIYNKAAEKYNNKVGQKIISLITNFKKQKQENMATAKKAANAATPKKTATPAKKAAPAKKTATPAKKAAPAKKTATPAKKAAPVKKATPAPAPKKAVDGEKKVSQKSRVVELADAGKTIDEIVEITGFKKPNVQWYFSKLKLGKRK